MSPQTYILRNWKDLAIKSAAQMQPDDGQMARAFMDQAYNKVLNRAGRLMDDRFRLGFEIVKKNETNTRILAVFAFKVGEELLYVPVFFLNGVVKGGDLLYRHSTKRITTLTPDWADYLIEQASTQQGRGITRNETGKIRDDVHMERIVWPPLRSKYASTLSPEAQAELEQELDRPGEFPTVLPTLMRKSAAAREGLLAAIERHPVLGDLLLRNFELDDIFPPPPAEIKTASAPAEPVFRFHLDPGVDFTKAASQDFFQKGYWVEDNRDATKLATLVRPRIENVETAGAPGVYDVLLHDGETVKAWIGPHCDIPHDPCGVTNIPPPPNVIGGLGTMDEKTKFPPKRVVTLDGRRAITVEELIYTMPLQEPEPPEGGKSVESAQKGKLYCILTPQGQVTPEFYVEEIERGDDLIHIRIRRQHDVDNSDLIYNPDAPRDSTATSNVLNRDCRVIEINTEVKWQDGYGDRDKVPTWRLEALKLGTPSTIERWLFGDLAIKRAHLTHEGDLFQLRLDPSETCMTPHERAVKLARAGAPLGDLAEHLDRPDLVSRWMTRPEMALRIMAGLQVGAQEAESWLDEAVKTSRAEQCLLYPWPATAKKAFALPLINNPPYELSNDPTLGVEVEYGPQTHAIPQEVSTFEPPMMRLGEVLDAGRGIRNDNPIDFILHTPPEQLAQMAAIHKLPAVLDHGVVGALASTYDASAAIDPLLPDLERGLDALGRCIFLLRWKPHDFKTMYGADDLPNIESQLESVFKSMGETLLLLLRRSKEGTGSPN